MVSTAVDEQVDIENELSSDDNHVIVCHNRCLPMVPPAGSIVTAICGVLYRRRGERLRDVDEALDICARCWMILKNKTAQTCIACGELVHY